MEVHCDTFLFIHVERFLNSFVLLEHLAMLLTSTLAINCYLRNFLNKAFGIINFAKPFLNFINDTMIWFLNSKNFQNLISMLTWCINWRRLLALIIFQLSSLKWFPILKRLAITLMYCNRLHAGGQPNHSSSLIARRRVWLQTLWWFILIDLSIDKLVGAWCFGCLSGPQGFTCWISFAPVFSFIYCWVLIFALSPCYILIYMFREMIH